MVVDTGPAILILALFVLPGFITLIFRERLYVIPGQETPFERLLQALFYSALIYGALLLVAHLFGLRKSDLADFQRGEKSLGDDLAAAVAIFVAMPGVVAIFGSRWMASRRVRPWLLGALGSSDAHGTSSGWNQIFGNQGECLIRATLTDGRIVGGFYGESSLVGYSEQTQDLYISQRWELDGEGWFVKPADRSLGIWLPKKCVVSLEVYETPDDSTSLHEETRSAAADRD